MATAVSPTREIQQRRRLSVDAEDELFKSLQGLQEMNNSSRANRRSVDTTRASSPGNHSGRMGRRSVDVTRAASPGNHSGRMKRRSIDVTRAASPGNHSGRMTRRSIDVSKSPGSLARRQRIASLTNGRQSVNNTNLSPKRNNSAPRRNNSGRRKVRSHTPPRDMADAVTGANPTPQPLALNRQSSGGTVRSSARNRRASTGAGIETTPVRTKGRIGRRSDQGTAPQSPCKEKGRTKQRSSSPKPNTSVSQLQRLGFPRSNTLPSESSPTSPKGNNKYPSTHSPTRSPTRTQDLSEMAMRADLLNNTQFPTLDNSTTSWASFVNDDTGNSDIEKPGSDRTDSTKTASTAQSSERQKENPDLSNLLQKLRDPAEMEKWKSQKEKMTSMKPSLQHDKLTEKIGSRNLKSFLQRSKRGYSQQANLDGLSVVQ